MPTSSPAQERELSIWASSFSRSLTTSPRTRSRRSCPGKKKQAATKTRPVFADALEPIKRMETPGPSAFEEMSTASTAPRAFSQGMAAPELATHERKRKAARIKGRTGGSRAPVRGPNKATNKTKEPKLDPQVRVDNSPTRVLTLKKAK